MNKYSLSHIISVLLFKYTAISRFINDTAYLKLVFPGFLGHKLDLENPKTYSEKLQWIKLYDRKPVYMEMVDKYLAKEYVAGIIGDEYIIPTYGVWDHFEDIDFDTLPDQFVLKCTHDSGGLVICENKQKFDKESARRKITKCLKKNYYWAGREWPYKDLKPRIIAEKYMQDGASGELPDYKYFTFNGKVKSLFIATDRQNSQEETKFDFYDEQFNHLDFTNGHPNASKPIQKPGNFELMKELAEKLSSGIPHLRVDFYEIDGKVYFGELTFFHWSGFVPFSPETWDAKFGEWLELPDRLGYEN